MTYKWILLAAISGLILTLASCGDEKLTPQPSTSQTQPGDTHEGEDDHDEGSDIVEMSEHAALEAGIVVSPAPVNLLGQSLTLPAEIRFDADRIANVSPQVSGVIRRLYASEGDVVKKGARLALLSSRELAALKAEFLSAKTGEALALSTLEREEKLWQDRITAEADLLQARAAYQSAKGLRENAETKLHAVGIGDKALGQLRTAADGALSHYTVTAPLAGAIVRRSITLGETVVSGEGGGQSMFTIADDSVVWADIAVFKQDLGRIDKGTQVALKDDDGSVLARGEISFISPIVDEISRTATARVVVDNQNHILRPGQFVIADLSVGQAKKTVNVPVSSVLAVEGQQVVFVPVEGGFAPRRVILGRQSAGFVEIVSGLHEDELFVQKGAFTLKAQLEKDAFGDGHGH